MKRIQYKESWKISVKETNKGIMRKIHGRKMAARKKMYATQ